MSLSPLASSIVAGGVFVMGLVIAGTLSDYKDAERSPTDMASGLYSILRETESMNTVWGKPDLVTLRQRLIAVVTTLRADINVGNTRTCLPRPAPERHRQAVQGRPGADRRRCEHVPASRVRVQAQAGDEVATSADEIEEKAEQVEQELVEIEEEQAAEAETAEDRTGLSTPRD